ncbi:alpha-1,2-fucosyltransferase [Flavobacterium xanthum]|uniref:Glycosyl transferase family 11 n=1 Tax=Flavobacterium xanthum TaxID=69322 RepID=A0A1M7BGJ6_9FLAO|nr:alpha-1,2-fucosyltransferase [Flavobacterium xanthum]SHL54158.1 Glycosyl transferase family 11 [Flavobacterium xanthum]
MITFASLNKKGNLGNQLFYIASTIGIAKCNGHKYEFPEWQYADYFAEKLPVINSNVYFKKIIEVSNNYYDWKIGEENYDITGALQSEKYFSIKDTKKQFEFNLQFSLPLNNKYQFLFNKKNIVVSVRRGDFVYHPNYFQLSYKYYFLAITKNFTDWQERNLIFLSDDINYCKYHFGFMKNTFFLENLTPMEQLAITAKGQDFVISNSTFSWWVAWLAEKEDSKIIRPLKNFRGSYAELNDDSDFFPSRWIEFDHNKKNISKTYSGLIIKGVCYQIFIIVQFVAKKGFLLPKRIFSKIANLLFK